mgnify:CR=1 FL=1
MTTPAQRPALYLRLLRDMGRKRLPLRRWRSNPPVVKRKMSKFNLKRAEHIAWPQPTVSFRDAIAVKPYQPLNPSLCLSPPSPPLLSPELALI